MNIDVHIYTTRDGLYKARIDYSDKRVYIGPWNTLPKLTEELLGQLYEARGPLPPPKPIC